MVSEGFEFVAKEIKGLRIGRLQVRKLTTDDATQERTVEQPPEGTPAPGYERKQEEQGKEQPSGEETAAETEQRQEAQVTEGKDEEKPVKPGEGE